MMTVSAAAATAAVAVAVVIVTVVAEMDSACLQEVGTGSTTTRELRYATLCEA